MDLRLRPDTPVDAAIESLESLALRGRNIAQGGGGVQATQYRKDYLAWAEDVERAIRHLFESSDDILRTFHSGRHDLLLDLESKIARPHATISLEAEANTRRMETILARLRSEQGILALPPGCIAAVPDTNVFIHCKWYEDIDWPGEVGAKTVRLVVPLLVTNELDSLSYRRLPEATRAKKVLKSLNTLQAADDPPGVAVDLPKSSEVTLQFLMDPDGHVRRENNDEELLERTAVLAGIVGSDRVVLVTRDFGMQLRARNRGLRSIWMEAEA